MLDEYGYGITGTWMNAHTYPTLLSGRVKTERITPTTITNVWSLKWKKNTPKLLTNKHFLN